MAFFDFLKHKEFSEISSLKNKILLLEKEIEVFQEKENNLKSLITDLKTECDILSKYKGIHDVENEKERVLSSLSEIKEKCMTDIDNIKEERESLLSNIQSLNYDIKTKKGEIVELDRTILLQEFGLYSPVFDFTTSEEYKLKIDEIRQKEKDMILNNTAATCSTEWSVDGSKAKGRAMTKQNIKQILRCFNDECDMLVDKVKFNNVGAFIQKVRKSYEALNRMNENNKITISWDYLQLKADEIKLAYEYSLKKQEEKEEQKRIREQMREEARLMREIEETRKDIEKEQKHYTNALIKIKKQLESCDDTEKELLVGKKQEIEQHLTDLDVAIKDIDYREANKRAGYVYIISNIGSFGENVYKIGMTRRLDPMERVDELGDASVPFKFDVHAMIFSDDAPSLETALHHAFENKKVNMINNRREFFNVTLSEIEEVVKANYDKTVEFVKIPDAEQYRESQKIITQLNTK